MRCPTCRRIGYVPLPIPIYRIKKVKHIYPRFYSRYNWILLHENQTLSIDPVYLSHYKYFDMRYDDCGDRVVKLRGLR